MAKSKVARSKKPAPMTLIEYSQEAGKTVARVRERSSGEFLAVAQGSPAYARRAAAAFAAEWSKERAKAQRALDLHTEALQRIRHHIAAKASQAVSQLGGAS